MVTKLAWIRFCATILNTCIFEPDFKLNEEYFRCIEKKTSINNRILWLFSYFRISVFNNIKSIAAELNQPNIYNTLIKLWYINTYINELLYETILRIYPYRNIYSISPKYTKYLLHVRVASNIWNVLINCLQMLIK